MMMKFGEILPGDIITYRSGDFHMVLLAIEVFRDPMSINADRVMCRHREDNMTVGWFDTQKHEFCKFSYNSEYFIGAGHVIVRSGEVRDFREDSGE